MSAPARKVLMVCFHFPPSEKVGSLRSAGFCRHLADSNWNATVLTAPASGREEKAIPRGIPIYRSLQLPVWRIAELVQGAVNQLMKLFGSELKRSYFSDVICFPDRQIWWLFLARALRLAREHDVLYVSCPPFSAALYSLFVRWVTKIPVVLDCRDPWYFDINPLRTAPFLRAIRRLERMVISKCDAVIVTSEGAKRLYDERYPERAGPIVVIPNGYDQLAPANPPNPLNPVFRIMHVGEFYLSRHPRTMLEALKLLNHPSAEFVQIGNVHQDFEQYRGAVNFRTVPWVEREKAFELMKDASLLYLRQGQENPLAIAAKTFDYLATGLPILVHGPEGENTALIRENADRFYVVTSEDPEQLASQIRAAVTERNLRPPKITERFQEGYSRAKMTEKLADVLDAALQSSKRRK